MSDLSVSFGACKHAPYIQTYSVGCVLARTLEMVSC